MPLIADCIKELNIDQATFAKVYEKVMQKKLTTKTTTLSDANYQKIQKIIAQLPAPSPKTTPAKVEKSKVLKSDELAFGGGGFLSGLGFAKAEEKPEVDPLDEIEVPVDDFKQDILNIAQQSSGGNSGEQESFSFATERPYTPRPARSGSIPHKTAKSDTRTPRAPRERGNVSIAQSEYKAKDKASAFQKVSDAIEGKAPVEETRTFERRTDNRKSPSKKKVSAPTPKAKVIKKATVSANLVKKTQVILNEVVTVKEFSEKIGVPLPDIMKSLISNGIMTSITANLDFDTASLIAEEFGVVLEKKETTLDVKSFMEGDLQTILDLDKEAPDLEERAPIVTVMGHVDHGKTSLLDYLRKTTVASGEAGGITQSIGASSVTYNNKKITFIDTPGHELFTSLRARGAKLTNIAIIVIAADDSVMPQTIESINHAKAAGVPIVIAITKIDRPGNNIEQIKSDVAKHGLTPEDWGGDTPFVGISSKTGEGIDLLLEHVLLQSEMLELKYNPKRAAVGVVVDAYKDPKQGIVSSLIILTGTLKVGDIVVAYNTFGKVRRMQNQVGKNINKVSGGEPVQILGFTELPEPGRIIEVVANEKDANHRITYIQESQSESKNEGVLQQFISQIKAGSQNQTELKLILKADGSSSLEALKQAVDGLHVPKNVLLKIVHSDVGHFGESDLSLAQASGALLIGFNITINAILKKKAENLKITFKNYDIIYELTDYLDNLLKGMIEVEMEEVVVSKLEVLAVFHTETREMTIGGIVKEGTLKNKLKFRVYRGEEIVTKGEILSLKRNKNDVKEVTQGDDCGMRVKIGKKIQVADILEFYELQEKKE